MHVKAFKNNISFKRIHTKSQNTLKSVLISHKIFKCNFY